jgi:Uma2 family endonuclease
MAASPTIRYAPEDLLGMPDAGRFELVDGQLQERPVSHESSVVALMLSARLALYVLAHRLGWVATTDCGLQIFEDDPSKVRFADGSFISTGRLHHRPADGHLRVAPDLVLEVVSPNDIAADVNRKVREYLAAGVRVVWVVYPETQSVDIYRPDRSDTHLDADGTLSGEDVVPGFSVALAELFDF